MPDDKRKTATVATDLIDQLKSVVGPSGYLEGTADTVPYCVSWRDGWQGSTPIVLRPKTTEEVSRIVKLCAEAGVATVKTGS